MGLACSNSIPACSGKGQPEPGCTAAGILRAPPPRGQVANSNPTSAFKSAPAPPHPRALPPAPSAAPAARGPPLLQPPLPAGHTPHLRHLRHLRRCVLPARSAQNLPVRWGGASLFGAGHHPPGLCRVVGTLWAEPHRGRASDCRKDLAALGHHSSGAGSRQQGACGRGLAILGAGGPGWGGASREVRGEEELGLGAAFSFLLDSIGLFLEGVGPHPAVLRADS